MLEAASQFQDAIRAAGLEPPSTIEPGRLHRFPGIGKNHRNRAAWLLFFDDGQGGVFGCWATGFRETWQAKREKPYSRIERAEFARRVAEAKKRAGVERQARQANAANRADAIWNEAKPALSSHPYLIRKGIQPHGARLHKGALALLVTDFTGTASSLQFISVDGAKRLLSGGRKMGRFIHVAGNIAEFSRVIICEGFATGATLAEDNPTNTVIAAIDAENLEPVAVQARRRWPTAEIIVAGDDDRLTPGNPGATKSRGAAIAAGALLAIPEWPKHAPKHLSDFNDLKMWLRGAK